MEIMKCTLGMEWGSGITGDVSSTLIPTLLLVLFFIAGTVLCVLSITLWQENPQGQGTISPTPLHAVPCQGCSGWEWEEVLWFSQKGY